MLSTEDFCQELVDYDYSVNFKNTEGMRIIVWKEFEEGSGLSPVADVHVDIYGKYNLNYRGYAEKLNTLEQLILSSMIIQYARTPLKYR